MFLFVAFFVNGQLETSSLALNSNYFETNQRQTKAPITATNFWRPFTIELNSNGVFHGISLEKQIKKSVFVRASFSSDFEFKTKAFAINTTINTFSPVTIQYSPIGIQMSLGVLFNILNLDCINTSLRTGLEFGLRQKPDVAFYGTRISKAVVEVPILLQYNFKGNYSFNIGIIPSVFRTYSPDFNFGSEFFYEFIPATYEIPFHFGLRYTFAEKQ